MKVTYKEDHSDPAKELGLRPITFKITRDAVDNANLDTPSIDKLIMGTKGKHHTLPNQPLQQSYLIDFSFNETYAKQIDGVALQGNLLELVRTFYDSYRGNKEHLANAVRSFSREKYLLYRHQRDKLFLEIASVLYRSSVFYDNKADLVLMLDGVTVSRNTKQENFGIEVAKYCVAVSIAFVISGAGEIKPYFKALNVFTASYEFLPLPFMIHMDHTKDTSNQGTATNDLEFAKEEIEQLMKSMGADVVTHNEYSWGTLFKDFYFPGLIYGAYCFSLYLSTVEKLGLTVSERTVSVYKGERKVKQGKTYRIKKVYKDVTTPHFPEIPPLRLRTLAMKRSIRG